MLKRVWRREAKLVKGLKKKGLQDWLKELRLFSQKRRRLKGDLITTAA